MKIVTVDCRYQFPKYAASYLVTHEKHAVVIDNGTAHSVPLILKALAQEGIPPENVDYVIITHVHLDHAGGSSALMKSCPNARLLAHPRAVLHVVDPSKLTASAKKVYGDEKFERLYGKIEAIPAERVTAMEDGEQLQWMDLTLRFIHTRGHANHHFCILVQEGAVPTAIFTGDAFGLAYPALRQNGVFIFPSTSPTDFDPEQAILSVEKIRDCGAPVAYPTHFGAVREIADASQQMIEELHFSGDLLNQAVQASAADSELDSFCESRIRKHLGEVFARRGISWNEQARELLDLDIKLNAAGIAHVARKRRGNPK